MIRRRCKTFGCANLHYNKRGYCDACIQKHATAFTDNRESSTDRGYDNRWRTFSKKFLAEHPVCVICGSPAQVTDHKDTPAAIMLDLYGRFDLDPTHYQALCVACNTRKASEDQLKVKEYFSKKQFGYPRGGSQKTDDRGTTDSVRLLHTHEEKHKGVHSDGEKA